MGVGAVCAAAPDAPRDRTPAKATDIAAVRLPIQTPPNLVIAYGLRLRRQRQLYPEPFRAIRKPVPTLSKSALKQAPMWTSAKAPPPRRKGGQAPRHLRPPAEALPQSLRGSDHTGR